MAHIFVTRHIPGDALEMLRDAGHTVTVSALPRPLTKAELIEKLKETHYDGVLSLLTDAIDKDVYDAAPHVKVFSNYAIGFNNFDIKTAEERGIAIGNTPGTSTNAVAEFTVALILATAKRLTEADEFVRQGHYEGWDPNLLPGVELRGKTLGLIGAGQIGSKVAATLRSGFGMNVVYYDVVHNVGLETEHGAIYKTSVEEVLQEADIVSLHTPLNEKTRHLINKEHFGLMKPTAILVNTSRGPVVEEVALAEALRARVIRAAAIDVYEYEPAVTKELLQLDNIIMTPHIASATEEARSAMSVQAAENLIDFFSGKGVKYKVV